MDEPIACSLDVRERALRGAWLERLRADALSIRATPAGVVARFPHDARIEADLRALAEAEAACCPFLSLRIAPGSDFVELEVSGPGEARPLIEELFGAPHV